MSRVDMLLLEKSMLRKITKTSLLLSPGSAWALSWNKDKVEKASFTGIF